jgi:amino acid transporter
MSMQGVQQAMGGDNLFLRKATGLVRSWSVFDAFIYAFFSINLVTLGFWIISQMYFIGEGGLIPALIISAIIIFFECVVYAALIAVMPRAGGDYVWQSRILGGFVGFVLAVTGWWFILWLWTPLYADMLRQIFFVPLLGIFGQTELVNFFSWDNNAWMLVCVITVAFAAIVIGLGMRTYSQMQKWCFWIGNAGLAVVCLFLLIGNNDAFRAGLNAQAYKFGAAAGTDVYAATMAASTEAGAALPLYGGAIFGIFLLMPYLVFFNLWPNWGATLYGEVKGADDFKRNLYGMAAALGVTTVLAVIFFMLVDKTITWDFMINSNAAYWNYRWGYTETAPPLPIWPYPALFAMFLTDNAILQFVVLLAMSLWFFGWAATVFLSSTRVIFAAAFDRLLPEKMAEVDPRTRAPLWAMLAMVIPGLIVSALYVYNVTIGDVGFQSLTLTSTMVIAVTYLGTTIGAILLPYIKKDLYEASPIAKYKVAGIPLVTVAGIIFGLFLAFLLFQWLLDPNALYGIGFSINPDGLQNPWSFVFVGGMYVLAIALYFGFKQYRKRQGIDIDNVYKEIPVE